MEIKHLNQIQELMTPAQRSAINRLISLLDVDDMRQQTVRFKAFFEDVNDDNMNSFYGVGYVFQTIVNSTIEERDYFVDNAEVVAGLMDGEEAVWVSIGGVYIFADGTDTIEVASIYDENFTAGASVPAGDIFEKFFATNAKAYHS